MSSGTSADVVVVGGRIAGCVTALSLAAKGVSVRLLESRGFPSDTLSTHFFRGNGLVRLLDDVGVLDEVLASGAPKLGCEYFSVDQGTLEHGPPQDGGSFGYCLSVRRVTLDAILARKAATAGVDIQTRTKVVDVMRRDDAVVGVLDEHGMVHSAEVVVAADGRRSTIARLVGAASEERHPPFRAMYYRYATAWRALDPVGPEFLLDGERFMYVFPSDGGVVCMAVSIPIAEYEATRHDPVGELEHAFRSNPQTADRMEKAAWVGGVYVGLPAESVWAQACGPGWALVGDAGTAQDPWSGAGMDSAAQQAECFVESFVGSPDGWHDQYARLRRERTYDDFATSTRLAPDIRAILA